MKYLLWRGGNEKSLMLETKEKLIRLIFDYDSRLSSFRARNDSLSKDIKHLREMVRELVKYRVYEHMDSPEGKEHTYVTQKIWHNKLLELANTKQEISLLKNQVMQLVDEREDARRTIEERNETVLSLRRELEILKTSNTALEKAVTELDIKLSEAVISANKALVKEALFQQERFKTWHTRILSSFWGKVFLYFNTDLLIYKKESK